jgi:hypothetical protein
LALCCLTAGLTLTLWTKTWPEDLLSFLLQNWLFCIIPYDFDYWFDLGYWFHYCRFDFDPLDVTKTWPEDVFPLQPVGRMVLNRNPDNFFNDNEQLAFCPALVVPGESWL